MALLSAALRGLGRGGVRRRGLGQGTGRRGLRLRQLTSGSYDDQDPIYLPDGRIAFVSNRGHSHARCVVGHPSTVLARCDADGLTKVTWDVPWCEVGNGPAERPETAAYHTAGAYRGEQELRAMADPDPDNPIFKRSDYPPADPTVKDVYAESPYRPRMRTAPRVYRAYRQDEFPTAESRIPKAEDGSFLPPVSFTPQGERIERVWDGEKIVAAPLPPLAANGPLSCARLAAALPLQRRSAIIGA